MPVPRLRLRELPVAARVLVTCFLLSMGAGFVAAQVNLRLQHSGLDGRAGLSVDDVVAAFHGKPGSTLLTSKIAAGGSMHRYVPRAEDREVLETWVAAGGSEADFEAPAAVLDRLCVRCHNPLGEMPQVPFTEARSQPSSFELVKVVTGPDTGMSYPSLARSSHAHLFGMGVLYALAGLVFLMTDARARVKSCVVALPFVAMFVDIGCWWLTKLSPGFAIGIVGGGVLLGVAFAVLTLWPLWELATPSRGVPDDPSTS